MQRTPHSAFEDSWILCKSKSRLGKCYYFNNVTGESSWTKPKVYGSESKANSELCKPANVSAKDTMARKTSKQTDKSKSNMSNIDLRKKNRNILQTTSKSLKTIASLDTHVGPSAPINPVKNSANKRLSVLRKSLAKNASTIEEQIENNLSTKRDQGNSAQSGIKKSAPLPSFITMRNNRKCNTTSTFDEVPMPSSSNESKNHVQPDQETCAIKLPTSLKTLDNLNKNVKRLRKRCVKDQNTKSGSKSKFRKEAFTCRGVECESALCEINMVSENKTISELIKKSKVVRPSKVTSKNTRSHEILEWRDIETSILNDNRDVIISPKNTATLDVHTGKLSLKTTPNRANERLAVLQKNLAINASKFDDQIDAQMSTDNDQSNPQEVEDMEWETILNEIKMVREDKTLQMSPSSCTTNLFEKFDNNFYIVVDTNVLISDLRLVKLLLEPSLSAFPKKPTILIPWRVLRELDALKLNEKTNIKAREAANYLRHELSSNTRLKGQTLTDAYDFIYPCPSADDEILNCCLQMANAEFTVVLLSNDNILCMKAQVNDVKAFGSAVLKKYVNGNIDEKVDHDDDHQDIEIINDNSKDTMLLMYLNMTAIIKYLLTRVLRTEMERSFGKFWDKIVYVEPPWTYVDILKCLLQHWVGVFCEKFTSDFRNLLINLREYTPKVQGNSISQEDFENFSLVAFKLFDSSEIQKDYSVYALRCKDKAYEICKWIVKNSSSAESINNNGISLEDFESRISTAFRIIWMFFCSYCSRVASIFNVEVEKDVICFEMFPFNDQSSLLSQGPVIYKQLFSVLTAISDVVQSNERKTSDDLMSKVENLNKILCDTLSGLGHTDFCTSSKELEDYCIQNRSILQEGQEKFNMLYVILNKCQKRSSEMVH